MLIVDGGHFRLCPVLPLLLSSIRRRPDPAKASLLLKGTSCLFGSASRFVGTNRTLTEEMWTAAVQPFMIWALLYAFNMCTAHQQESKAESTQPTVDYSYLILAASDGLTFTDPCTHSCTNPDWTRIRCAFVATFRWEHFGMQGGERECS